MNTDNTEKLAQSITETLSNHRCPKCGKAFQSVQALRMHTVRVHTLAGRRGALMGGVAAAKSRHGKTMRDKSCPLCSKIFTTRQIRNWHLRKTHGQSIFDFPELLGRVRSNTRRYNSLPPKPAKQIRYVYPDPEEPTGIVSSPEPKTWAERMNESLTPDMKRNLRAQFMKHCPKCGHDLSQWEFKAKD